VHKVPKYLIVFLHYWSVDPTHGWTRLMSNTWCQWRRLHTAWGARAPTFTNGWAQWGTVRRGTANNKLTKLHCPSRKRPPKRRYKAKKVEEHDKTLFSDMRPPPLTNSFWRHCLTPTDTRPYRGPSGTEVVCTRWCNVAQNSTSDVNTLILFTVPRIEKYRGGGAGCTTFGSKRFLFMRSRGATANSIALTLWLCLYLISSIYIYLLRNIAARGEWQRRC